MEATGPDSFSLAITMLKAGGALLLIIGLLVLLMIALRKLGLGTVGRQTGGLVRVVESKMLGPRKSLAVVEAAGEYLLLGITDQQVTTLATLPPEEVKRRLAAGGWVADRPVTFAGILAGAVKRRPPAADSESTPESTH